MVFVLNNFEVIPGLQFEISVQICSALDFVKSVWCVLWCRHLDSRFETGFVGKIVVPAFDRHQIRQKNRSDGTPKVPIRFDQLSLNPVLKNCLNRVLIILYLTLIVIIYNINLLQY